MYFRSWGTTSYVKKNHYAIKDASTYNSCTAINMACTGSMRKKKVCPTLALFVKDFTTGLKDEFG